MTCSSCGTENEAGRKFCKECAARLSAACPSCGTPNSPDAKFCGECAAPLRAGTTAGLSPTGLSTSGPEPASLAERRHVSVLFADLVGFTPYAEGRDTEEVRETLSRYFDVASDIVARYGGTVEKFIGDAVMAVWGAPTAQEDDAERAVRAGLELVGAVRSLGPGIEARAGVLTGEAAVTVGATNQGMVAGDLVNTAARLQSVAPSGAVLVGEATYRAANRAIAFEEAGEHVLKGKAAPIRAWRALRVVAQRGGQGRSDLPEPPFVGRDDELRLLRDALNAAGRDRRTRLISITGPGGIGKSRLAWELEKYIDGVLEDIYWHRGRSPAYGDGVTFWALGEMVRRRARLAETDDEAATRARIAATVAEYVPDADDRRWVEPALLTLLGFEPAPPGGRDVLFAAWRIFFERIAAKGTTVLLFEDLQWADSGLLEFIDHLLEWSKGAPILVVTLARPELFDRRPDWGVAQRNFTAMALEPLPDGAMRELLAGFVPGLPPAAVEAILARADGMPLYAVETVRALVAEGRLEPHEGAYRPVGELGELTVPETLRSLIASRLDALEPADRALVQEASVLGQTFSLAALVAVSGRDEAELLPRLRGLVRRQLFEVEADPRSPERGQYRFVQSLIREVAYDTLARRERRARHLAAARHFEALGEDELAGALATHYLAAHAASAEGPEAEAVAVQARLALRAAGERAATLGAHDQAVVYFSQALAVTTDSAEAGELRLRAAISASDASDHEGARMLASAAVADFGRAGEPLGEARATAELGSILLNAGEPGPAIAVLEAALERPRDEVSDEARARLLATLSRAYMRNDDVQRAIETADRALPLAERLDLVQVVADAFNNKGSSLSGQGRRREATALLEAAVAIAHESGFVSAELRARSNLVSVAWSTAPLRAYQMQVTNLALARRVGNQQMATWMASFVAAGAWQTGLDWDAVIADTRESLAAVRGSVDEGLLWTSLGFFLVARGEPAEEAQARLDAIASASSDPALTSQALHLRGARALVRGDLEESYESMVRAAAFTNMAGVYLPLAMRPALWLRDQRRAREVVDRIDGDPDAAAAFPTADRVAAHAGLAALEGRPDEAAAGYRDAFRRYRELGVDFYQAGSILDMVTLLGAATPEAAAAAAEARGIFERVRARPYLAWLDAALAASSATAAVASTAVPVGPTTGQPSGQPTPEGRSLSRS